METLGARRARDVRAREIRRVGGIPMSKRMRIPDEVCH